MLLHAHGTLEEAGQMSQHADGAYALSKQRETGQIENQRSSEDGIATLPGKLHAHLHIEKTAKVDEIPRRFPIIEGLKVLDGNVRLRLVAHDLGDHLILGANLR